MMFFKHLCVFAVVLFSVCAVDTAFAQRVGFVSSNTIRERYPDYRVAQQRIESIVNDWKKELEEQQTTITAMEAEIQKKRLVWNDTELREKEATLQRKKAEKDVLARKRFNAGGDFDTLATNILRPVEAKVAAAIQDVAYSENYDYIWDKNVQPLIYANPKYDITVKVMEKLGIYVDDLKAKLQEAIDKIDKEVNKVKKEVKELPNTIRRRIPKSTDEVKDILKDFIEPPKDSTGTKPTLPRDKQEVPRDTTKKQ